jgi:hypothetical protein
VSRVDAQRQTSGKLFVDTEPRSESPWRAAKNNPYLLLAAGPVVGWLTSWLLVSALDSATYSGSIIQYSVALIVTLAFLVRGSWLLARRGSQRQDTRKIRPAAGGEKELLVAMRDAGGAITPVEAALETSLTVDEAERMLSHLAERGHLRAESRNGALYYAILGDRFALPTGE